MNTLRTLVIIPARYASSRFPGKPLVEIGGKSMVQRVYEQAIAAELVNKVIVATDDSRIFDHIKSLDYQVLMTKDTHQSGTDRCAEVAAQYPDFDIVVNVQGDEPFIAPEQINQVIQVLKNKPSVDIATLVKKIKKQENICNNNIVKVVFSQNNEALYFSRNPIPYLRGIEQDNWIKHGTFYKHIGMYAFRQKTLLEVADLAQSPLEIAESLEQLRWLDNGYSIGVDVTTFETVGIDTPEDLERLKS